MKRFLFLIAIATSLLLMACSESLTAEQQEAWDLIEERIEEGYETWEELWHWAVGIEISLGARVDGERPSDEILDLIDEFGLVGNYIESEPGFGLEEFGDEDEVILLSHFEYLNYNEDVRELSELDMSSEVALNVFYATGGLDRLEENFASVTIVDILEDTEEVFENDGSIGVEFLRWDILNSGFVSFENSYIYIVRFYDIVEPEPVPEEIQAMVIEMLNEMDSTRYIDFGYHTPSAGHSGNVMQINQPGLANILGLDREAISIEGSQIFTMSNIKRVNQDGEDVDPSSDEVNESKFIEWNFEYEVNDEDVMTITFTVVYDIELEEEEEEETPLEPVDLFTGEWEGGADVPVGRWVITGTGSGNFTIWRGTNLHVNEILGGGGFGVTSITTDIVDGDEIGISGLNSVTFTPVIERTTSNVLSTGHWVVGEDIEAGSFDATTPSGSGNFVIWRGNSLRTNEILGNGSFGIERVRVNLANGDRISISGLERVYFEEN